MLVYGLATTNIALPYIGFLQKLLKMTITDVDHISNLTYGTNCIRGYSYTLLHAHIYNLKYRMSATVS